MRQHPEYIADEFAEVFEYAVTKNGFDVKAYLRYRDDFFQFVKGDLEAGEETVSETASRFERAPELIDSTLMSFAAGNAEYYSRILGIPAPAWCGDIPPLDEDLIPFFPFPMLIESVALFVIVPMFCYQVG